MTANKKRCTKYSAAQDKFVRRTRHEIDTNSQYFETHDWRKIESSGGRKSSLAKTVSLESFYVKPIAAWVPDKLFVNHAPSCPHCKSNRHVEVQSARWINTPKVLYGISSHSYLDTKLYPCWRCSKMTAGLWMPLSKSSSSVYPMATSRIRLMLIFIV